MVFALECKQFYKFLQIILLYNLRKIKYTRRKGWKDMDILASKHNEEAPMKWWN